MVSEHKPTAPRRPLPPDARPEKGSTARAVGAFVPKLTAAAFERFGFHSAEIMMSWDAIVGGDLARLARPEAIKWPRITNSGHNCETEVRPRAAATLTIACDPAHALEVSYRTQTIIDQINRYFGYRAITQLKIRQVPMTAGAGSRDGHPVGSPGLKAGPHRDTISTLGGGLDAALRALGLNIADGRSPR